MSLLHNKKQLKADRRNLRNNLTPAEATLWRYLQRQQLGGRKFRRQHSIDHYVVDFYCVQEWLAVELDGSYHFTGAGHEADKVREAHLNKLGISVVRFENQEVFDDIEGVLARIQACFSND